MTYNISLFVKLKASFFDNLDFFHFRGILVGVNTLVLFISDQSLTKSNDATILY